jgi:hypothetical protein
MRRESLGNSFCPHDRIRVSLLRSTCESRYTLFKVTIIALETCNMVRRQGPDNCELLQDLASMLICLLNWAVHDRVLTR